MASEPPVDDPEQIKVNPTAKPAMAAAASRDFGLLIAALPALVTLFGAHSIKEAVDFTQSTGFAPLAVVVVAVIVWMRQRITFLSEQAKKSMAEELPNSVATIEAKGWLSRLFARMGM